MAKREKRTTFGAFVFHAEIFLEIGQVDQLARVVLVGVAGEGHGIVVGAGSC